MSEPTVIAYQSARPGSMFPSEGGGYINRGDASSLAGALLELLAEAKDRAEEAERELAQHRADAAQLIEQNKVMRRALGRLAREPGCGCEPPCRCDGPEWSRAEMEGRIDVARAALARVGGAK